MVCHNGAEVKYAPLYIHQFSLKQVEKEEMIPTFESIGDKLRWLRHQRALTQKQVAHILGIDRSTYSSYENPARDYYPLPIMEQLSRLFGLPLNELLDEYNLFLQEQATFLREQRSTLGLNQKQYAHSLNIPLHTLKKWESGAVRVSKESWEKHFKCPASK